MTAAGGHGHVRSPLIFLSPPLCWPHLHHPASLSLSLKTEVVKSHLDRPQQEQGCPQAVYIFIKHQGTPAPPAYPGPHHPGATQPRSTGTARLPPVPVLVVDVCVIPTLTSPRFSRHVICSWKLPVLRRRLGSFPQQAQLVSKVFPGCCEFALPSCSLHIARGSWKWG